jgi:hypothetical protein
MSDTATAAKATLDLVEAAITANLAETLKQPGWEDARAAFQDASRLLIAARALAKTSDGWRGFPAALDGRSDDALAPIGAAGLAVAAALSSAERIEALANDGKRGLLEAALAAGDAQAAAAGVTADLDALRAAVAPPAQPVLLSEVPTAERLHGVATAALDLLEAFDRTGASLPNTRDGRRALELQQGLEAALRDGDFALPGEILGRTLPYAAQAPRGTRAQQMTIFEAAGAYADHLRTAGLVDEIEVSAGPLARAGLLRKFQALDSALAEARSETPVALETPAAEPSAPSPLSTEQAKALLAAVDLGNKIADSAQLDTLEPEMIMFPREHLKTLGDVLGEIDRTAADLALRAAYEEGRPLPGVSDESMKALIDLVLDLRDVRLGAAPRGEDFCAVPQEDIDRITSLTDRILYSGAREGLAAAAGESETSAISMTEGLDSAAFATLEEAMRGGARLGNPESALGTLGKILPEMGLAEWHALSPRVRATARVVFIEPGKGEFKDCHITVSDIPFGDPRARKSQEEALRAFIRRRILDDTPLENGKGTVGERFLDLLLKTRDYPIVAPTRPFAKVVREEGERIAAEIMRQNRQRAEIEISKFERVSVDFDRAEVARFLRVLEAQGSSSPANLVKMGEDLLVTHPDGPTLKAKIGAVGSLARHQDGHVIAKLHPEELRGAVETGHAKVRVVVMEDRVAAILGHTPAAERARSQGGVEIAA